MRLGTDATVPESSMMGADVPNLLNGGEPGVEDGRCDAEGVGEGFAFGLWQVVAVIGDKRPEGDDLHHHPEWQMVSLVGVEKMDDEIIF